MQKFYFEVQNNAQFQSAVLHCEKCWCGVVGWMALEFVFMLICHK